MEATTSNNTTRMMIAARLEELGFDIETFNDEKLSHKSNLINDNPAVYCGSWSKYNNADLSGMWIDLSTFSDYDEFRNFCCALHADEADPELMFQDYDNFPADFYSEDMGRDKFDKIQKYIELCDNYDHHAVDAWVDLNNGDDLDNFERAYQGEWDSEKDFAEYYLDEFYGDKLSALPSIISNNINYEDVAIDLFHCSDYTYYRGFVFLY